MIQTSPGVLILVLKSELNSWYWWKRANWVVTTEPETTADRSQLSPISSHAQIIIIINRLPNKNCLSSFLKIHFEDGRLSVCTSADTHTHTHTHTHTPAQNRNTSVVFPSAASWNLQSFLDTLLIMNHYLSTFTFSLAGVSLTLLSEQQRFLPHKRLLWFSASDVCSSEYRRQKSTAFTQRLFVLASADTTQTLRFLWGFSSD